MSYKSISIKQVIDDIGQSKFYLPALQRKFVWEKHQIELLFDSLMRNYPIGTFLFWRLKREKARDYVFYKFLVKYDERDPFNKRELAAYSHSEITGVLDGQQRLSSMYIGLNGTHTEGVRVKWSRKEPTYEETRLCINLLSLPYEIQTDGQIRHQEEKNFEFRFLSDITANAATTRKTDKGEEPMFWMKVSEVLWWQENLKLDRLIQDFLDSCNTETQKEAIREKKCAILKFLEILRKRICEENYVNYFEITTNDLEDILKIFVRVNSGGTVLNQTDLLFSTIVATWNDGREQIEELLKKINNKQNKFNFGNDYLMRCCLVLADCPVVFKVQSFKSENVQRIQNEWPQIADAINKTADLLVEFGFSGDVLTSQNATIIIAYYFYKGGDQSNQSKENIRKYLIHALLNGVFGSAQDQVISALRNAFREEVKTEEGIVAYRGRFISFSFEELLKVKLPQQKSLAVTESDLERFLGNKKGPAAFFILSLLYPYLRFQDVVFHQDHIHPVKGFNKENFLKMEIPELQWEEWLNCRDCVPNLQLLNGPENLDKHAHPLIEWIGQKRESERTTFLSNNFFPSNVGLEFKEFKSFFHARKEELRRELKKILAMVDERPVLPQKE